jgi:hypothetical protein
MLTCLWGRFRTAPARAHRNRSHTKQSCRLKVESLGERCLPSADVVLQWNQAVLAAVRNDKPTIGFVTRDLAIVHTAISDAVSHLTRWHPGIVVDLGVVNDHGVARVSYLRFRKRVKEEAFLLLQTTP